MDHDRVIVEIAAQQHGVVTRAQLLAAGVPPHVIEHRTARRRLELLHRGVYRLGPVRSAWEREMAAVLACGGGARASNFTAAALWDLLPRSSGPVHVTVQHDVGARPRGVRVHRVRTPDAAAAACVHGIPCTDPARTIVDLACDVDDSELERMLASADRREIASPERVRDVLKALPHHRGVAKLRHLLAHVENPAFTRSQAESRFLALVRRAELRTPAVNTRVRGYEVDFLWRTERLVVEIDGFAFHSSADAYNRDRLRDAVLTSKGLRVMRITWRQLTDKPESVLVRLAQALAHHP